MGLLRTAKGLVAARRGELEDAVAIGLVAAYRFSGRRLPPLRGMYRAEIARQGRIRDRLAGMTTVSERAFFRWSARELFTGSGTIVDLGSGFGSTTAALARGLCANPRPEAAGARIHAFDRFVMEPWMEPYAVAAGITGVVPDGSFLEEFEAALRPWLDRICIHQGNLMDQAWSGEGIELLLIDAMKSWELAGRICSEFYPALLPGNGHLIHQDYSHCFTPWIHLISYRLRDRLVPSEDVRSSETVAFRVARPVDDLSRVPMTRDSFDEAEVEEAFRYSRSITRREKHSGIYGARCMLAVHDGDLERAERLWSGYASAGLLSAFHASSVRGALDSAVRPG